MQSNGPLHQVERCSRSSYEDDDGRMQGGKNTATCEPEFQMVNTEQSCGQVVFGHVISCHTENFLSPQTKNIDYFYILPTQ